MTDVTVVIPFWDLDPKILQESIDSVRFQSKQCKILLVDNKSKRPPSPKGDVEILRLEERVTAGEARNRGLAAVNTPYVMFMDADDILLPGAIANLYDRIANDPAVSIVAGQIINWNPELGIRQLSPWPSRTAKLLTRAHGLFRYCNAIRNMTPVTGCAMLNTRLAKTTAGFTNSTAEEWPLGTAMGFRGKLVMSDQPVKLYRLRSNSLSDQARYDVPVLFDARRQARKYLLRDAFVPLWFKFLIPIIFLLQAFELPLHVKREHAWAKAFRVNVAKPRVATPAMVPRIAAVGSESAQALFGPQPMVRIAGGPITTDNDAVVKVVPTRQAK